MKKGSYSWAIMVIGVVLMTTIMIPVHAQTTTGDTEDPDNFADFITCLFDGTGEAATDDTTENVVDAIEGTAQSVPTEQDIRDCFEPIYEPTATGPATGPAIPGIPTGEEGDTDGGGSEGETE
jgi:hypothetical protein